ncbi:MAG: PPC domain-containing DNA-binding protein [Mesorhizobium sp.]
MKSKLVAQEANGKIHVMVLDPGEEAFKSIEEFAAGEKVAAASLTAIGAFSRATVGWFDIEQRTYLRIPVDEQCEVLSAVGDVALGEDGKPAVHVHVVLGMKDGSTRGGHLLEGYVQPTLEVVLTEMPRHLQRRKRADLGIALIDLTE